MRLTPSAVTLALLAGVVLPAHAQLGTNLIVNPGAEMGGLAPTANIVVPVPGWTTTGNATIHRYGDANWMLYTSPGPVDRGDNFFYGGPASSTSALSQTIDLSFASSHINLGAASFSLSGWLGGYQNQNDRSLLRATFVGPSGNLGSAQIGPVFANDRGNVSGLLFRSTAGAIPVGTTSVNLVLEMARAAGGDNDGYSDNLAFTVTSSVPEPGSVALLTGMTVLGGLVLHRRARR